MVSSFGVAENQLKAIVLKRKGVALALWGEAGIGKTHKVQEILQALPCKSLRVHATSQAGTLAQTLPKPKKLALWAEHTLTRVATGEAVDGASILDSWGAVLAGLAPFVLCLEDFHEADPERIHFIQDLARLVLQIKGVGIVVTSRHEPPEPFTAIKLEPLSLQETNSLLEAELKSSLPREALEWIYNKAAGNPLYTLEYLRFLSRQGFLWNDGKHWHWRRPERDVMPVTVEALIEQLLTQAKPWQQDVLAAKALLPSTANDAVYIKVAGVSETDFQTAIAELSHQGIFKGGTFAHPLFREVTLNMMGAERKRDLARSAIVAFQDHPDLAALFVEAAGLEPDTALAIFKTAAEQVKGRNHVEAARFLAKAVAFAEGEEKGTLALEAATRLKDHDLRAALHLAETALTLFPGKTEIIDLLMGLFAALKQRDKANQVMSLLSAEEKQGDKALYRQLRLYSLFNDHRASLELVARNPNLLESNQAEVLDDLIWTMIYTEQAEMAKKLIHHALALTELTPLQRSRFHYARALAFTYFDADDRAAERELAQALAGYRKAGNSTSIIAGLHAHAGMLQNLGHYQQALPELEEAAELSTQLGNSSVFAAVSVAIADQLRWSGHYERAEELYLESLSIMRRHDDVVFLIDCLDNLAALYCDWRTPHSAMLALKYGREALTLAKSRNDSRMIVSSSCTVANALVLAGNVSEALELASEALSLAHTPQQTLIAQVSKVAALKALGHHHEALELCRTAEKLGLDIGRPYQTQLVCLELDHLNNNVQSARKRMHWFAEHGLLNGVTIAKRYFPELAETEKTSVKKRVLQLEVLGSLRITEQTTTAVRGRKRQELLALLLEARISGRREVPRLTLIEVLYPDDDELKASSSLTSIIHSLRETFGESVILTTASGYTLGNCTSDAEVFLQTGDTLRWAGTYLEGLALSDESSVRDSLYLALADKATALLELDPKEAARVGSILIEAEPYRIEYLKIYLTALRLTNSHGKLARHYQDARERFLEVGETLPDTWQDLLSQSE